jgi:hypothetical protein
MERYKFVDDSESNIEDHFSKIFQQKEKSIDEFDLFSKFELTHQVDEEASNKRASKCEFLFDALDIEKEKFDNISLWTQFLLHDLNKMKNRSHSELDINSNNHHGPN